MKQFLLSIIFTILAQPMLALAQEPVSAEPVEVAVDLRPIAAEINELITHEIFDYHLTASAEIGVLDQLFANSRRIEFIDHMQEFETLIERHLKTQEANFYSVDDSVRMRLDTLKKIIEFSFESLPPLLQPDPSYLESFRNAWDLMVVQTHLTPSQISVFNTATNQLFGRLRTAYTSKLIMDKPRTDIIFYSRLKAYLKVRILEIICETAENHNLTRVEIGELIAHYGRSDSLLFSVFAKLQTKLPSADYLGVKGQVYKRVDTFRFVNNTILETLNLVIQEGQFSMPEYPIRTAKEGFERSEVFLRALEAGEHESRESGREQARFTELVRFIRSIK